MMKKFLAVAAAAVMVSSGIVMAHTVAKKGMKADLVLMPKFLGILVFSALFTPPDIISQLGIAIPLIIFYEVSIAFIYFFMRK